MYYSVACYYMHVINPDMILFDMTIHVIACMLLPVNMYVICCYYRYGINMFILYDCTC